MRSGVRIANPAFPGLPRAMERSAAAKIHVVVNGAEAVEAFRHNHYGTIIMDIHMPVMDGEEAFREIEEICLAENWEKPFFVFCTGFRPPESLSEMVKQYPRHRIVEKPVDAVRVEPL